MSDSMHGRSRKSNPDNGQGFLRRLLANESGNVIAMTAAATIPMLGVIGGAIDISRVYLTKSRVQAACDSAVLAGRKAMTTAIYTTEARNRADSMFNVNFQDKDYGTSGTEFNSSANATGVVSGTAITTVPMAIMGIFGAGDADLTVNCSADIQVPNIDVVLVLDVTGSMDSRIGGKKKIDSLKLAAKDFYDTLTTAMAGNTTSQIRYGFVPYSEAVNGADLFKVSPDTTKGELPMSHFVDTMSVQSRVANFNTEVTRWVPDSNSTPTVYTQRFDGSNADSLKPFKSTSTGSDEIRSDDCSYYSSNLSFEISSSTKVTMHPRTSYPGNGKGDSVLYLAEGSSVVQTSEPTSGNSYTKITFSKKSGAGWWGTDACTRYVTHTKYIRETGFQFTDWTYRPVDYTTSSYKNGSSITYATSADTSVLVPVQGSYDLVAMAAQGLGPTRTTKWTGCIEERATVAATSFAPIPSNAYDLNYLDGGTSDTLRWRPFLPDMTYDRERTAERPNTTANYDKPDYACPTARVRNLNVMTKTEFYNYIDTLSPNGNTYLDIGMIWGLRLIAPQGMFASRNLTGPNGGQISRHIIFLTDGEPVSATTRYTAYGVERTDRRITGSNNISDQATLHARRFQALCDAQRGVISIWAIAFGTSVTGNLESCADPGRSFEANSTAELQDAFKSIASEVADLRLIQ